MSDRTTSATGNVKDAVRDTARDINKATSKTQSEIADDLESLRADIAKLAEQVGTVLASKGSSAYRTARAGVDGIVSDASAKAEEARDAAGEVVENFTDAIEESIEQRPYTTLAMAVGLGFLLGALWRR
jgi:ElaB/YqjD/DUF883 family membrane-anchored ribosome-binding protein